jgi:hypothetical protein
MWGKFCRKTYLRWRSLASEASISANTTRTPLDVTSTALSRPPLRSARPPCPANDWQHRSWRLRSSVRGFSFRGRTIAQSFASSGLARGLGDRRRRLLQTLRREQHPGHRDGRPVCAARRRVSGRSQHTGWRQSASGRHPYRPAPGRPPCPCALEPTRRLAWCTRWSHMGRLCTSRTTRSRGGGLDHFRAGHTHCLGHADKCG